ncbi:hypothetical protein GRI72_11730 [Altererythrobacter marinus]|uniref:DUF5681 domain-containing protein n=1 Tax=Pelagerythrobacter marinus TaxID=538382 RepID=A0ABW9UXD2_9SPHN|nr:DUF5681 domain-containing protein [Pelagerythrobacter marinus]MXO69489.1 hypothetical protein [Pelagerythrobacter marinus]
MSDEDDYTVGYGRPPRHSRFRKGQSGNPAGRPKKQKASVDLRSMLERVASEEVDILGRSVTMLELELMAIQRKAAKGDIAASKHLNALRTQAGCNQPQSSRGGVLVVPGMMPLDKWSAAAALQQEKFRGKQETDVD